MAIVTGDRYLDSLVRFVERNAGPLLEGTLTLKLNPVGLHYVQSRLEALEELERLLAGAPVDYLRAYVSDLGDHRALEQLRRILRLLTSLKVFSVLPPPARDPTPLWLLPFGRLKVLELRGCDLSSSTARGLLELRHTLEKLVCHNSTVLCPIIRLVLRNNALTTLRGIENLKSVEGLDLSYNILSTFSELEILASLPSLQNVWLEGNPICCARWYRAHVFSFFSHPENVKLDEKGINTREYWERQVILASRHKRPAGYGFYFPAKENANDDGRANIKRKKVSRLASIEDEEGRRCFCAENVDQDSASCDSDNLKKDETVITDSEAEIIDLMNRVEFMKKEQSVLWLRDFREWMDQATEDALYVGKCIESNLNTDTRKYTKQRKGEKHLGKCPMHVKDILQTSEGECSINFLEPDLPYTDTSIHGHQLSYSNGKVVFRDQFVDKIGLRIRRMHPGQDQLEVCCKEPLNSVPLEKNDSFFPTNLMFEGGKVTEGRKNSASLTAIEEIIGSRQSSLNPGSPPHYQEDILQRRQNLEDEFLQLSAGSYSVASSGSGTSCSDDDSCKFSNSFSGLDQLLNEESVKRNISGHSSEFQLKDDPHDARERDIIRFLTDASAEPYSNIREPLNHGEPFPTYDMDDSSSDSVKIINKDIGDRRKGKLKPKRRVVALLEEHSLAANKDVESKESNEILEVHKVDIEDEYRLPSCNENCPDKLEDKEQERLVWNPDANNTPSNSSKSAFLKEKPSWLGAPKVPIEKYFFKNLADSGVSETCEQFLCCDCILGGGSDYQEREVAVLLSNKQKVYVLLINVMCDRPGMIYKILGCHRLKEIKEIVIGLDLQALRIQAEGDVSYMFLVKSAEKVEKLLYLLHVCDSSAASSSCSIKSWDQVQIEQFDKHVCGGLKMSIFLYSMLLFWHDKCEGESWLTRSLFLVEGYVLVCFENLVQFGKSTDDIGVSAPYFSLDSCWPIENILEMVIEPKETRCLTLTLDHVTPGKNRIINKSEQGQWAEKTVHVFTWRLKWFSEERLLKFVTLLKAIHAGLTSSPLRVKCIS